MKVPRQFIIALFGCLFWGTTVSETPVAAASQTIRLYPEVSAAENTDHKIDWTPCVGENPATRFNSLGVMYAQGNGVTRDTGMALVLFSTAASYRNPVAMINLATMYESAIGVTRDFGVACGWLRAAIAFGATDEVLDVAVSRLSIAASRLGPRRLPRSERIARNIVVSLTDEEKREASARPPAATESMCIAARNRGMGPDSFEGNLTCALRFLGGIYKKPQNSAIGRPFWLPS